MTNRERIDKMTNEELARELCHIQRGCPATCPGVDYGNRCTSGENLIKWLEDESDMTRSVMDQIYHK